MDTFNILVEGKIEKHPDFTLCGFKKVAADDVIDENIIMYYELGERAKPKKPRIR